MQPNYPKTAIQFGTIPAQLYGISTVTTGMVIVTLRALGMVMVSDLRARSYHSKYGNVLQSRYVTDVLPLLPLLPPVNSSQGGLQSARFYIGCHLDHIWKVGSVAPIVEIGEPVP